MLARIGEITERSATDPDLRRRLIEDGTAALRAEGLPFGDDFSVAFIENTALTTIVLPDYAPNSSELSDEQLEAVAGGAIPLAVGAAWFLGGCVLGMCAYLAGKR